MKKTEQQEQISSIWNEVLGFIQTKEGGEVVETWFQPTKLGELNGTKATIVVPNEFFGNWLERNYREMISEALQVAWLGEEGEVNVEFIVGKPSSPMADKGVSKLPAAPQKRRGRLQLPNPEYTFENFVVGASNQFAHAASLKVAETPARSYNPFFIYGGTGLGKTHLLNSIGSFVLQKRELRIAYVTTEEFTNEVVSSIRYDKMMQLRQRFRNIDMLLIDDIQFLASKERTQEEFFHTFSALYESGKQIVLSSDRFPKEMPLIEERLRSRFESGLITDLQPPDLETRIAILQKKSEEKGIVVDNDVILFLAEGLKSNVRELECALNSLEEYHRVTGQPATMDVMKTLRPDLLKSKKGVITPEDVQGVVAKNFHVKVAELKSKRRTKAVVHPRQVAMYLCRELTNASFPEIGREFGGKDHTTIIHAYRQIEKALEKDNDLRATLDNLKDEIGKV